MLIQRAKDLGCISDRQFKEFRIRLSRMGWHTSEPVDLPSEVPSIVQRAIGIHLSEHAVSALAGIARHLFGDPVPAHQRPVRWFEAVQEAQINHSEVMAPTGQPWEPSGALGRWFTHYTRTTSTTGVPD